MHTERRSPCVLKWTITCRRPVIVDVIQLCFMRFRIYHLLAAITFVAIGLLAAGRYSNRSVLVAFKVRSVPPESARLFGESGYTLDFTIHYDQYPINGLVGDSFGFNAILNCDVNSENVAMLDDRKIYLTYRKHSLPWLPATRIEDQIGLHFDDLLVFPNADEWRSNVKRR